MKHILFSLLVATSLFVEPSVFAGEIDAQEMFHRSMIERDPNSEKYLFDYAFYLSGKERYPEAKKQLETIFRLNPQNEEAKTLQGRIAVVEKISDPEERKMQIMNYAMEDLKQLNGEMEKTKATLAKMPVSEEARDRRAAVRADLEKRYQVTANMPSQYQSSLKESQEIMLAQKYLHSGDLQTGMQQFEELRKRYPDSPRVLATYALTLVSQNKFEEAATIVAAARRFPKDIELRILSEGMGRIQAANSTEAKLAAKQELNSQILEFGMLRAQISLQKLKPTAAH